MKAYEEIVNFLASGTTPRGLVLFKASPETKERVRELLQAEKLGIATASEKLELDDYLRLEHFARLIKAEENRRKTYKTVEEAFDAKHDLARKFLENVDMEKMAFILKNQ